MRMMKFYILLAIICSIAQSVFARLGESITQVRERYGNEVWGSTNAVPGMSYSAKFKKDEMQVELHFVEDGPGISRSVSVVFQKGNAKMFTQNELDYLLEANAQGHKWGRAQQSLMHISWTRDDGAEAVYDSKHLLRIVTPEAKRISSEAAPRNLHGF